MNWTVDEGHEKFKKVSILPAILTSKISMKVFLGQHPRRQKLRSQDCSKDLGWDTTAQLRKTTGWRKHFRYASTAPTQQRVGLLPRIQIPAIWESPLPIRLQRCID